MKLTADLISNSPTYINAIKDRELNLSDNNIAVIENLGATRDLNDSLNLCHNCIRILGNFPTLARLKCLYLADNRIAAVERDLSQFLPNLHTLVLSNNDVGDLVDLEPLRLFDSLEILSLVNNPVVSKTNARLWCIWRLSSSLRVLDFERVTLAERQEAKRLFETKDGAYTDLANSILSVKSSAPAPTANTFEPGEGLDLAASSKEKTAEELQKEQSIAELKAKIRDEMAKVEAMEEFI
ncbi:U2 snRNP complex subunit [Coemansia thaxteri]|uniref:U2 small nuclear ribonucleoprotein A' n=1 Tax=Coemansia thaxteri TaxID=2663907 RepID=A0A9W8BA48_9FUNG|nr:U2 snRNP complex subunit [Coemansia thaxteri]KAJ2001621.1 U2 snRNP complex subunit [Coemansia thaxteri]KAJ2471289.1 U2 snRNP complex subunit [Coemansia sp. RSA 2322]KAJ2481710.1 U2 snRNP complex subunit [Coemansia sp. RSA 2320]